MTNGTDNEESVFTLLHRNTKSQTHKATNPHLWFIIKTQTHPHINTQTHKSTNAYIKQSRHKAMHKAINK